jgi:hypothetical protein
MIQGMDDAADLLAIYLHLARASALRQRPLVTDRFLSLAAVTALKAALPPIAACCRARVLAHNRHHLLGKWDSVSDALGDENFMNFYRQLERRYPPEKAEQMLASLGIDRARERESYFHDGEYAAALLGMSWEQCLEKFGP